MANERVGPDLVMDIRYAGASEIRAVTDHEIKRVEDGSSAIDPARSHLNRILLGPRSQQAALKRLWAEGVGKPARQAERPYVQMVLSASPEFFRNPGHGPGEWNDEVLQRWVETTMKWLRKEYGSDLVHVSLHLDEDTPHLHVLVVPTYLKKPRTPGRQNKGEGEVEFAARRAAAEAAEGVRTVGRSSNAYWKREWARRDARKSCHRSVEPLGIGYGRDFVEEGTPSPRHRTTGKWVREEAARLAVEASRLQEREAVLLAHAEELVRQEQALEARSAEFQRRGWEWADELRTQAEVLEEREMQIAQRERQLSRLFAAISPVLGKVADRLGVGPSLRAICDAIQAAGIEMPEDPIGLQDDDASIGHP